VYLYVSEVSVINADEKAYRFNLSGKLAFRTCLSAFRKQDKQALKKSLGLLRGMIYLGCEKIRTGRPNDSVTHHRFCQG
jgi:hypothetical protein